MTPFRSGMAFTLIIILYTGASLLMSIAAWRGGSLTLPLFQNIILTESIVLVPGFLIALFSGAEVEEIFRFKKIKPGTVVMVILLVFCIEPLVSLVNAITLLFSDNVAMEIAEQYFSENSTFLYVALVLAIIGPLAEELAFRGIIYAGLRKSGRFLAAILLQAFLFGLMHLNFNQMGYAFVLGVVFGILNEVTNSLWPGLIGHFMINFSSVAGTFAIKEYMPEALAQDYSKAELIGSLGIYAMLAVIFTGAAGFLLAKIAEHEPGGKFRLYRIFRVTVLKAVTPSGNIVTVRKPPVITVPVVIGVVIALAEMTLMMINGFR